LDGLLVLVLVLRGLEDLDPVVGNVGENLPLVSSVSSPRRDVAHPLLEQSDLLVGQSVGLGDDGDEVDLGVQPAHELDINGFEAVKARQCQFRVLACTMLDMKISRGRSSRVSSRLDKVDARVHAVVDQLGPVDAVLLLEVRVEPGLDVVDNGLPAIRASDSTPQRSPPEVLTSHRC
jgi:hypothetical protein